MRDSLVEMHVHIIWATWDRLPLITKDRQSALYTCIKKECHSLGAELFAIGGVEDHVHVLLSLPATVALYILVKQIKGASSHLATQVAPDDFFKWQGSYAAYAVETPNIGRISKYIQNQEEHHRMGSIQPDLEMPDDPIS